MSSGEHQAVTESTPAVVIHKVPATPSSSSLPGSPTDAAESETAERKKQGFASSFDQLVASNLRLVSALDRLIRVSYVLLFTSFVMWLAIVALFFFKR